MQTYSSVGWLQGRKRAADKSSQTFFATLSFLPAPTILQGSLSSCVLLIAPVSMAVAQVYIADCETDRSQICLQV